MKKTIDIQDYDAFIEAGFKECPKCGWAFDPEFFDEHKCDQMSKGESVLPESDNT